ncbi:chromate transporter [uncultured Cetobacterium sp.]|uniref:chromate transporter n=1 Tax=uncultured Cetobacterium sp. TaxID=527638 RepID=UPI00263101BB|nr:chromate transporter [uncultured Cetobacterium sp.]
MNKFKKLLDLFFTFSKIGTFTFGGGYAMFPILQKEIVEKKGWATDKELADYFAIGQCTPGIIAVNTATFIGGKTCGMIGGIVATLGFVFPALIIIQIIAIFIQNFAQLQIVQHVFSGVRVCVSILILQTVITLSKKTLIDKVTIGIFLGVVFGSLIFNLSPIFFVVASALLGIYIKIVK